MAKAPKTAEKPAKDNGISAVTKAVPMPEIVNNRGSKSKYPFDEMTEVGMSFGVKNKTAASMASVVSGQNRKHRVEKKDENGNTVFKTVKQENADGTVVQVPDMTKPEMEPTKKFYAADVDPAKDPDGASVRVFRSI